MPVSQREIVPLGQHIAIVDVGRGILATAHAHDIALDIILGITIYEPALYIE